MRVMVMLKATQDFEGGVPPGPELAAQRARYHAELVRAGVVLAGGEFRPSREGLRLRGSGSARSVVEGPFADSGAPVAGFWLWQVRSMDEALEWARRCPDAPAGEETEIEIRSVVEATDVAPAPRR